MRLRVGLRLRLLLRRDGRPMVPVDGARVDAYAPLCVGLGLERG